MAGSFSTAQQAAPEKGKRRFHRRRVLTEPPGVLLVDIAFNLLLFFVACASTEPSEGRRQDIPRGESKGAATAGPAQNLEISLTRDKVAVNNVPVPQDDFRDRMRRELAGKTRTEDRIVVVRSSKDTPYYLWVAVTSQIEQAGGIITLQLDVDQLVPVQ